MRSGAQTGLMRIPLGKLLPTNRTSTRGVQHQTYYLPQHATTTPPRLHDYTTTVYYMAIRKPMPEIQTKTKFQAPTLRTSQSNSMTTDGGHRWLAGKPLLVAFQRAIYDLHPRSLSSIAKCAKLVFGFCFLFGLRAQHHWLPIPTEITTSPRYACNPPLTSEKPHPPPRRVCIDPTTPQP